MIAIRRHLHQHPELSFQEKATAAYIKAYYEKNPRLPNHRMWRRLWPDR